MTLLILWLSLSLDHGLPRHPAGERNAAIFHGFGASVCLGHLALWRWPALVRYLPGGHLTLGALGLWFHFVSSGRHTVAALRGER